MGEKNIVGYSEELTLYLYATINIANDLTETMIPTQTSI